MYTAVEMAWLADERQHDVARPIKKKRGEGREKGEGHGISAPQSVDTHESTMAVFPAWAFGDEG